MVKGLERIKTMYCKEKHVRVEFLISDATPNIHVGI